MFVLFGGIFALELIFFLWIMFLRMLVEIWKWFLRRGRKRGLW